MPTKKTQRLFSGGPSENISQITTPPPTPHAPARTELPMPRMHKRPEPRLRKPAQMRHRSAHSPRHDPPQIQPNETRPTRRAIPNENEEDEKRNSQNG